VAGSV